MPRETYKFWSAEERARLHKAVLQHTNYAQKVDWDLVADEFPNRTRLQCKSFYQNIMKRELNIRTHTNHRWTPEEEAELLRLGSKGGWEAVRSKHFPSFTVTQLQSKYSKLVRAQHKAESETPAEQPQPEPELERLVQLLRQQLGWK